MERRKIAEWAAGMVDIFANAKPENVQHEIQMLLESLGLTPPVEYWQDKYE